MGQATPGPSLIRRTLLCPFGLCNTFRVESDDKALWSECTLCGRTSGQVSREYLRRQYDIEDRDRRMARDGSIFPRFAVDAPMPTPRTPPSGGSSGERPKPPSGGPSETPPYRPHGCICPPTSELTCRGPACPRKPFQISGL